MLFVSGDKSQVGKSSVCLGLVAWLHERGGYAASELAYMKPATQCESEQPVTRYCKDKGIDAPAGPVTYVSGFTRAFLAGETKSSEEMLDDIREAVGRLRDEPGRRLCVIDGVGYPSVGSIVGMSNAAVANAIGAPVILVCPPGVGNAVDSFNLGKTFFEAHGVHVLGAIFNRLSTDYGDFYARGKCEEAVRLYFAQTAPHGPRPFGFLPVMPVLADSDATQADKTAAIVNALQDFASVPDLLSALNDETLSKSRADADTHTVELPPKKKQRFDVGRRSLTAKDIAARAFKQGAKRSA